MVAALARGDRSGALETLDTLSRAGEYMPLALAFLATQFRMALAAREAGLRTGGEIQKRISPSLGARIWPERAWRDRADSGGVSQGSAGTGGGEIV